MTFTPIAPAEPVQPHTHVAGHSDLATHEGEDVVCLHNVSYRYDRRVALSHITLHVKKGSTLGVIGPNGGGEKHADEADAGRDAAG